MKKKLMKTNKQKNLEHDARAQARIRPAPKTYDFDGLQAVMKEWAKADAR